MKIISFTRWAGADVPVSITEGIVQISVSQTAVAAIVQVTKGLPQQGQRAQGPQHIP